MLRKLNETAHINVHNREKSKNQGGGICLQNVMYSKTRGQKILYKVNSLKTLVMNDVYTQ